MSGFGQAILEVWRFTTTLFLLGICRSTNVRTWEAIISEGTAPRELLAGGPSVSHYFTMTVALLRYDTARRALAAAHWVYEVGTIRDKAPKDIGCRARS